MLALAALLLAVFLFLLFQGLKQNADEHQAPAAQALHAGTMHQQLLSGKSGADQPERETEPVQKRSWFSRFFGD